MADDDKKLVELRERRRSRRRAAGATSVSPSAESRLAPGKVAATDSLPKRPYDAERQAVEAAPGNYEWHGGPKLDAAQGRKEFWKALAYYFSRTRDPQAMRKWLRIRSKYHPAVRELIDMHMEGIVSGLSGPERAELVDMMKLKRRPDAETKRRLEEEGPTAQNLAALQAAPRSRDAAQGKALRNRDAQHRQGDAITESGYLAAELPGGRNGLLGFGIGDHKTNRGVQARLEQVIAAVMRSSKSDLAGRRAEAGVAAKAKSATTEPIPGIARLEEAEARVREEGERARGANPVAVPSVSAKAASPPLQRGPRPILFGAGVALLVIDYLNWYASLDNSELVQALRTYRSRLFATMGGPAFETTNGTIYLPPTGAALTAWFDAHIHTWREFHDFWNFDAKGILVERGDTWAFVAGTDREGQLIIQPVEAEVERLFARLDLVEQRSIGDLAKSGARKVRFRAELDSAARAVWLADGGLVPRVLVPLAEGAILGSTQFLVVGEQTAVRAGGIGRFYQVRGGDVHTAKVLQGRNGLVKAEHVEEAR